MRPVCGDVTELLILISFHLPAIAQDYSDFKPENWDFKGRRHQTNGMDLQVILRFTDPYLCVRLIKSRKPEQSTQVGGAGGGDVLSSICSGCWLTQVCPVMPLIELPVGPQAAKHRRHQPKKSEETVSLSSWSYGQARSRRRCLCRCSDRNKLLINSFRSRSSGDAAASQLQSFITGL